MMCLHRDHRLPWAQQWIETLLAAEGHPVTAAERADIGTALQRLALFPPSARGMRTFLRLFQCQQAKQILQGLLVHEPDTVFVER